MKSIYLVALMVLTSLFNYAQEGNFLIADLTTLQVVTDAKIYVSENNIELPKLIGQSGVDGYFAFNNRYSSGATLIIQAEGYELFYIQANEIHADFVAYLSPTVSSMNTLIVSARRQEEFVRSSPSQATVISKNAIQFINPANSADLLSQSSAALVQKSQLGGGSPILRGFEANKVMYVVDGIRMNNAIYRGGHLQDILSLDPMAMERVEIIYGPGAATYGSDALGGVMSFYTRNPKFTDGNKNIHAGAMLRHSSADQSALHGNVEIQSARLSSFTAFTFNRFGDLRQGNVRNPAYINFGQRPWYVQRLNDKDSVLVNANPNIQFGSGYKQYDFLQKIAFKQNAIFTHQLNIQYSTTGNVPRYDRLVQTSGLLPKYAEWFYGPQTRAMVAYHCIITAPTKFYNTGRITLAFQDIDQSRHDRKFNNLTRNNRIENVKVYSLNADFSKDLQSFNQNIGYGIEGYFNQVNSNAYSENIVSGERNNLDTRYPDGGSQVYSLAAYLTHNIQLTKKLKLSEGLRFTQNNLKSSFVSKEFFDFPFTHVEQNNHAVTGSIGLNFQPTQNWMLRTNLSSGFRAPNIDDLAKVFESAQGNLIIPNNELKPEEIKSIEIGVSRLFKKNTELSVNAYYSKYTNAITTAAALYNGEDSIYYDNVLSAVVTSVNASEAFIYGGNMNLNSQVNKNFAIQASFNYTYGRIKTEAGNVPLDHIPPTYGKFGLCYQQSKFKGEFFALFNGWKRIADYRLNAEDNETYATPDGMPAWYTLNARISYQFTENIQGLATVENILDANYRVFASNISGAGRNLSLTLRGNF